MPPNQPRAEPRLNPAGSRQCGGTHCSSAVSPRPSPPLGVPLSVTSARPTTRTPDGCRAAPRHPGVPPKLLVPARRAAASSRDRSHFPGELPVGNSPVIPGSGIDSRDERGAREGPPNAVKPAPSPAPALPGAAAQRRFTGHQHRAATAGATAPGDLPGAEDLLGPGAPPSPRGITSLTASSPRRVITYNVCTAPLPGAPCPGASLPWRHHTQRSPVHRTPCTARTAGAPLPSTHPEASRPPGAPPVPGRWEGVGGGGSPPSVT